MGSIWRMLADDDDDDEQEDIWIDDDDDDNNDDDDEDDEGRALGQDGKHLGSNNSIMMIMIYL